jgi:hypothetical protein
LAGSGCGSGDPAKPLPEPGKVKRVPADYPTIQAALDAAVHVAAGSSASLGSCAVDTSQVGGSGTVKYHGEIRRDDPRFCRPVGCTSSEAGDYHVRDDSPYQYPLNWGSEEVGCGQATRP